MKEETEARCKKVYVRVNIDVDEDGNVIPRCIYWDDGSHYEIDRVLLSRKAASTKVGGCAVRYTVKISGREAYLYNEDDKWFVEAKIY